MGNEFFGMDEADFMIRAEEEGHWDLVDTRLAKINAIANELDRRKEENPYTDPMDYIDEVIEDEGLDPEDISPTEKSIINRHL